jgi:hypothetical protein
MLIVESLLRPTQYEPPSTPSVHPPRPGIPALFVLSFRTHAGTRRVCAVDAAAQVGIIGVSHARGVVVFDAVVTPEKLGILTRNPFLLARVYGPVVALLDEIWNHQVDRDRRHGQPQIVCDMKHFDNIRRHRR